MKKYAFLFTLMFPATSVLAQYPGYWQQKVDYKIVVDFDNTKHQFKGTENLTYYNNSPDTLKRVFYHLYFNAFQPGSVMDVRSRTIPDPDPRVADRIFKLKPEETGYHEIKKLQQDGTDISFEVAGTILEVTLAKPVAPGASTVFYMEFDSQVPIQIRRTGRNSSEGVDYSMTQWYPKMCEYDEDGWHADPYVGREFYGVWGDFDVKISIAKKYILGGTGYLQNPQEVGYGYEDKTAPVNLPKGDKLTWHFKAPMVHDFAWAADPDYLHDIVPTRNGPILHFLYLNDSINIDKWKKFQPSMVQFLEKMNTTFGKYPYEQFSFIHGGDGGMEYPMATLITSKGSLEGLIGVGIHEAIHNWYYGVLATNECKYPWMDEGFTSFASDFIEDYLTGKNAENPYAGSLSTAIYYIKSDFREPMTTHGDFYAKNKTYGISAYVMGEAFLAQLMYVVGDDNFFKGMKRYFEEWKFKHPTPEEFIRVMEKTSGLELDWYLEQFVNSLNSIDYGIYSAISEKEGTSILLKRTGDFPMPIDIRVTTKSNQTSTYHIPLDIMRGSKPSPANYSRSGYTIMEDWPWVNTSYQLSVNIPLSDIATIQIDPSGKLLDINPADNTYTVHP